MQLTLVHNVEINSMRLRERKQEKGNIIHNKQSAQIDDSETYAPYGEPSSPRKFLRGRGGIGIIELFCHDEYPKSAGNEGREGPAPEGSRVQGAANLPGRPHLPLRPY